MPRSDFGWTSHRIFLQILRWDTAIFVVVQVLLLVAVLRFRERDPKAIPRQVRGSAMLEIAWTLIPALILTFIAFPTVSAIFRTQAAPPKDALRVKVIGHQWWWEFQYPELGIVTASDLHLPAGRPVSLEIGSVDVIHSFWVPRPRREARRDPRAAQTRIVLTADAPGVYYGQCAEFCGASHANMRHLAVVQIAGGLRRPGRRSRRSAAPTPPDGSPAADGAPASSGPGPASAATRFAAFRGRDRARPHALRAPAARSQAASCPTRRRTWRAGSGTRLR